MVLQGMPTIDMKAGSELAYFVFFARFGTFGGAN